MPFYPKEGRPAIMTQEIVSLEKRRAALQSWILVYVRNGDQVVAQTDTTAQLGAPALKREGRAYLQVDEFGDWEGAPGHARFSRSRSPIPQRRLQDPSSSSSWA